MHTTIDSSTDDSVRRQPRCAGWAVVCALAILFHLNPAAAKAENLSTDSPLRNRFLSRQGTLHATGNIVRLGIFKLESGYPVQVRFDHPFCTGDQFRLEVTAMQRGWLYVLHRQQGEEPSPLWPQGEPVGQANTNAISAYRPSMIPPSPLSFTFDDEVGREYFYVVINRAKAVPAIVAIEGKMAAPNSGAIGMRPGNAATKDRIDKIVNFTIRGCNAEKSRGIQSVVSYPGKDDPDDYIYFANPLGTGHDLTVIEFKLHHE